MDLEGGRVIMTPYTQMKGTMKKQSLMNQLTAMKDQLIAGGKYKGVGRIQKSGGRRIPSVSLFSVKTGEYNVFLEQLGINLRVKPEFNFERTKYNRANRYIGHQLIRIKKYNENDQPGMAGKIAGFCIHNSISFRVSAINYVMNGGFFKYNTNKVYEICRKVERILRDRDTRVLLRRVYITKMNGKLRPLGVPSIEGRIVLHMYNNMLTYILYDKFSESQHAYLPGRGIITAGRDIMEKIHKYKYIYETDLKGFFDNIKTHTIISTLEKGQVPGEITGYIQELMYAAPKIEQEKMSEINARAKDLMDIKGLHSKVLPYCENVPKELMKPTQLNIAKMIYNHVRIDHTGSHHELYAGVMRGCDDIGESKQNAKNTQLGVGVPQGLPISPLLAIIPLREKYLDQGYSEIKYVNYADDQIFFANEYFDIRDNYEEGIIHNDEKCGWIKYDGEGEPKGLKFLGLRLLEGKYLFSETSGLKTGKSVSEYMTEAFKELEKLGETERFKQIGEEDKEYKEIFKQLGKAFSGDQETYTKKVISRNIFGFVLSCMGIGDWTNARNLLFRSKGMTRLGGSVNKNSFIRKLETLSPSKIPTSTTSSASIYILFDLVKRTKSGRVISLRA